MTGRYTVTDDLEAVAPLVVALADRYAEYENDGATAWDRTVNVQKRPAWLRDAANVKGGAPGQEEAETAVEIDLFQMSTEADPEMWRNGARKAKEVAVKSSSIAAAACDARRSLQRPACSGRPPRAMVPALEPA